MTKEKKTDKDDYNVEVDKSVTAKENQMNQIEERSTSDERSKRAAEILDRMNLQKEKSSASMINKVKKGSQRARVVSFGNENLPAGPDIYQSKEIIVVEGRADVINLLKMGIENTIAIQGTNVPNSVINLTKQRKVTALLDGDRGGDAILKELLLKARIDYVARAPKGKEVEHLDIKEINIALNQNLTKVINAEFIADNMSLIDFLKKHRIYKYHK